MKYMHLYRAERGQCGRRAAAAALFATLMVLPATAAPEDTAASEPKNDVPQLERMVPIPSYAPPVEDNGCPVRTSPSERPVPFFELISDDVGRYSVKIVIADGDPRQAFIDALKPLDPETRTLATLYALWDGLGRDGLHTFFYMKSGAIALEVQDALKHAAFTHEHEIVSKAITLFGPRYPVDEKKRETYFGYARGNGELDPFDHKLLALAKDFPSRDDLAAKIEGYAVQHPALWQRIEATRKKLGAQRRVGILLQHLWREMPSEGADDALPGVLEKFTKPERTLLAIDAFNSEFENGGVHQFFFNSTGAWAPDVYDAFIELGLSHQARLFKRAIDLFASPYPRDRDKRSASYKGGKDVEGFESELSDLTDAFYAIEGGPEVTHLGGSTQISGGPGIRDAIVRYAEEHKLLPC